MTENYVDFGDVYKVLRSLGKDIERESNKIMNDIAPDVAQQFTKKVPYYQGSKNNMTGKRGLYMEEHMRDNVVYDKAKDGYVEIGFDEDVSWRIHFTELGTIKQPPQNFIEKAIDELAQEVQMRVETELARRLMK